MLVMAAGLFREASCVLLPSSRKLFSMKTRPLRSCILFVLAACACSAVEAQTFFQRVYGGFSNELIFCGTATSDSSIIVGGYTQSFVNGSNSTDLLLMKCDVEGDVLWTKHYDVGQVGVANDVVPDWDNGVIVTGTDNHIAGVVMNVNAYGTPVWGRRNTDVGDYYASSVGNDSAVFVVGITDAGNTDVVVEKLTWGGAPIWSIRFGSNYDEEAYGIMATLDGGAIVSGGALVSQSESDGLLLKLDASGNVDWVKSYGIPNECDVLHDVVECPGGGFLAVGAACYSTTWPLIVRTDAAGDTLWTRRLSGGIGRATEVALTSYGYLISGNTTGAPPSLFMVAMDDQGNVLWDKITNVHEHENGAAFILPDERAVMMGDILDGGVGQWDVFVASFSSTEVGAMCYTIPAGYLPLPTTWQLGTTGTLLTPTTSFSALPSAFDCTFLQETICTTSIGIDEPSMVLLSVYPNPTFGPLTLVQQEPSMDRFFVTDVAGRPLAATIEKIDEREFTFDLTSLASGIYVIHARSANGLEQVLHVAKE